MKASFDRLGWALGTVIALRATSACTGSAGDTPALGAGGRGEGSGGVPTGASGGASSGGTDDGARASGGFQWVSFGGSSAAEGGSAPSGAEGGSLPVYDPCAELPDLHLDPPCSHDDLFVHDTCPVSLRTVVWPLRTSELPAGPLRAVLLPRVDAAPETEAFPLGVETVAPKTAGRATNGEFELYAAGATLYIPLLGTIGIDDPRYTFKYVLRPEPYDAPTDGPYWVGKLAILSQERIIETRRLIFVRQVCSLIR